MGIESRVFRQASAQFATGVTVVSFELDGEIRGMTANSFTSVSLDPPLILFCVTKDSRTGLLVHRMARFCVNVLGDHQRDVSAYFAGSWKSPRPPYHAFILWEEVQRLDGALAVFSCRQHRIYEGGDHWIVVGEVVAIARAEQEGRPLVFYKGGYVNLEAPGVRLEDAPMTIAWSGPFG